MAHLDIGCALWDAVATHSPNMRSTTVLATATARCLIRIDRYADECRFLGQVGESLKTGDVCAPTLGDAPRRPKSASPGNSPPITLAVHNVLRYHHRGVAVVLRQRHRTSVATTTTETPRPTHTTRRPSKAAHPGRCRRDRRSAGSARQPSRKLKGDRADTYSIRINDQWRICFRWTTAGPEDVEIVDYH